MIPIPLRLKMLVPGYRAKWRARYAGMLAHLREHAPRLAYGEEDGAPWIEVPENGARLFGFWTERANEEVFDLLVGELPAELPKPHFRLVKDYLNRYLFPHMRPDWKPDGYAADRLFGFHAQHKDAIADLDDPAERDLLNAAFRPKPDDVFIDGGAFLGFGEIRLSSDVPEGHFYAIEADRECHALLARNITANGAANVTALHRALWNKAATLDLETGFAQSNTLVSEVYEGERRQKVETISVDQIVEKYSLSKVDMLSLTLNGAEVEALEGARRTLADLRPRIRLAGWYSRDDKPIWQWTKAQLEPHGYRVFVGKRGNLMALPS